MKTEINNSNDVHRAIRIQKVGLQDEFQIGIPIGTL